MSTQYDQTTPQPATDPTPAGGEAVTTEAAAVSDRPRRWRRLLLRGRSAVAAGVVAGGLAILGLGFGAGYAVGDHNTDQDGTTQQTPPSDRGDGQFGGPGEMGGPPDGQAEGGTGSSGQAPDFDGDGQPDDTSPESNSGSAQNSAQQG